MPALTLLPKSAMKNRNRGTIAERSSISPSVKVNKTFCTVGMLLMNNARPCSSTNELLLAELHPVAQPLSLLRLTVLLLPTLQALLQHQQARTSAKETPTALPLRVATITILPSAPGN